MAVRELHTAPRMLPLFARAGVALIPGASRLPFVGGQGREIPDLQLVLRQVPVERDRLAAYNRVCAFPPSDTLPPTYPHVFAFPLALALMTDPSFPFPAIGLVHIANQITQHRPIGVHERLTIKVWSTPIERHARGKQFTVLSEARVGDELVWEEGSTNLRRGGGSGSASDRSAASAEQTAAGGEQAGAGGEQAAAGVERAAASGEQGAAAGEQGAAGVEQGAASGEQGAASGEQGAAAGEQGAASGERPPATATWNLPADLGRRYASVSGDFNPIHMHRLSARLFGFPSAIAHGMWTKARCLAALQPQLPARFTVEVSFRRPILLPASVQFAEREVNDGVQFEVRDASKGARHLTGRVDWR